MKSASMHRWDEYPKNTYELQLWKVYCRIFNDLGWPTPGSWIVLWIRSGLLDPPKNEALDMFEARSYGTDALNWYIHECRE